MQPGLLLELADKQGVVGLLDISHEVRDWYELRDFEHFIAVYEASVQTLRDEENFALLVEKTARGLAAHIPYPEVMLTPHVHLIRGMSAETTTRLLTDIGRVARLFGIPAERRKPTGA